MAADKKDGRARHKGHEGRRDQQGGGVTPADVDPWGSFLETFWEQAAESESGGGHAGPTHEISHLKTALKQRANSYPTRRYQGYLINLECIRLAYLLTLLSLTTPCALIALISCVTPALDRRVSAGRCGSRAP
jgi:hypothetical protein